MNKLIIELGGKERTLKFNNIFAREYEKKRLEYDDDVTNLSVLLYAGIKAWAVVSETKMIETFEDCCDLAEDVLLTEPHKVQEILEAFTESNFYKAGQEVKKKIESQQESQTQQIGMQLNVTHLAS